MIADFLELFYTKDFDDKTILKNNAKSYTVKELKYMVLNRIQTLSADVIPSKLSSFEFVIEILARIFVENEIFVFKENQSLAKDLTKFPKINPDKVFIKFQTSGSTGNKKIISKSLTNLIEESNILKKTFPFMSNLEFISTTTLKHLFGFSFHFMFPLNNLFIINTTPVLSPEDIFVNKSCLVTTPSFLGKLHKYNNIPQINPKLIISGGANLTSDVFLYTKKFSDKVIEIYGSTETGIIAYRTNSDECFKVFEGIKITSNQTCSTIDTKFSTFSPVIINDKITKKNNNQIIVEGRTDRTFKIQEKRINADEIENFINSHEFIDSCYVIKSGEKLACLTVLSDCGHNYFYKYGAVELIKVLKKHTRDFSEIIPQRWKFIDEIPVTDSGKVDISAVNDIFDLNISIPLVVEKNITSNYAKIKLYFYKNCNFFNGHFVHFPITPGVAQIYLAQYFSKKFFNTVFCSGHFKKIKFTNIIRPDMFIDLELELLENKISYKYCDENQVYSSGLLPLKKEEL